VADLVLQDLDTIVARFVERVRSDALIPEARAATRADIEDHSRTLLTDVVQSLAVLEELGGAHPPDDARPIRHELALRHGQQRARLGWSERAMDREVEILSEEVDAALRRVAAAQPHLPTADAAALLRRVLGRARQVGREGYRGTEP
jgi:hypothetical protein